jgi:Tfp pilus assembly PilM family ATPase
VVVLGADVLYKVIELPEMRKEDVLPAIQFKLKSSLPFSFKDVVVDFYKIDKLPRKGKHLYFVSAVPKANMQVVEKNLRAAGIGVKDIVSPSVALKNSLDGSVKDTYAAIYFGKYSSVIILVKEGQVVFAREAKVGGDDITQAMVGAVQTEQGRLELDYAHAEEIKNKFGIPIDLEEYSTQAGVPASELLAMMRPALEKFGAEIWNTFDFYKSDIRDETEFKKIYITGGVSRTKNLLQFFKQYLGIEVEPMPIKVGLVEERIAEDFPVINLAVGAVITAKDHLSLLPKEERGAGFRSAYGRWVIAGLIVLGYALALFLVFGWFNTERNELISNYRNLQNRYRTELTKLGEKAAAEKRALELAKYGEPDRFPLVMQELNQITPSNVYFQRITYNKNGNDLFLYGVVVKGKRKISVAKFVERLNKSLYIDSIELIFMEGAADYPVPAYDFELRCKMAVEEKKQP